MDVDYELEAGKNQGFWCRSRRLSSDSPVQVISFLA